MIRYCINLPERPEKWDKAQEEFKKLKGNVIKWNATKKVPGYDGCRMSHLAVLQDALFNYPGELITVFEDDVEFIVPFPEILIENCLREIPLDWDMLYLGATLTQKIERVSPQLFRLKKAWTTHAMIFNNQNGVIDFILENGGGGRKIDVFYADVVQEKFNCYLAYPMIANQRDGFSDILNREVPNGKIIKERYEQYTT